MQRDDDNIVTSKFFSSENQEDKTDEVPDNRMEIDEPKVQEPEEKFKGSENLEELRLTVNEPMDVDEMIVSSPKEKRVLIHITEIFWQINIGHMFLINVTY